MNSRQSNTARQRAGTDQTVETLLCLLASYDGYGTGQAWPHCPRLLPDLGRLS